MVEEPTRSPVDAGAAGWECCNLASLFPFGLRGAKMTSGRIYGRAGAVPRR